MMKSFHIPGRHTAIALALAAALGGCATDPPEKLAATDQDTDLSTSLFRSAAESRAQGDLTAAATLYRQSHSNNPERSDTLIGLGQVLLAAGTPKPAADVFRKSLIIDTGNVEALRGLGNALIANDLLGKHSEAQEYYRTGLSYKADDLNLLTNLGLSLSFSGKHDESIEVLRKLVDSPHATPHHRQNLALVFGLAGRRKDAAKISRTDLDRHAVRANLAYYATLRALSDSTQRVKAVHARNAVR